MSNTVKLPVAIRECTVCGAKFVPVSKRGTSATHCPDCRRKQTQNARNASPRGHEGVKRKVLPALVTTLEWYDTSEKLPDTSRNVFEISESGCIQVVVYNADLQAFNVTNNPSTEIRIALWANLPEELLAKQEKLQQITKEDN